MKLNRFQMLFGALSFLSALSFAAEKGEPFAVTGEQIEYEVPSGWKLAWMEGSADGPFVAEYIPQTETIEAWREGYLQVRRIPYPPAEVLARVEKAGAKVADIALLEFARAAGESCGGRHIPMEQRTDAFNGMHVAVTGGYCDKYGPAAPYGEGSLLAYAEGRKFLFFIQYGWRPKSEAEQKANPPWRVAPDAVEKYAKAIRSISLCGGEGQVACKRDYAAERGK